MNAKTSVDVAAARRVRRVRSRRAGESVRADSHVLRNKRARRRAATPTAAKFFSRGESAGIRLVASTEARAGGAQRPLIRRKTVK